MNKPVEEARCGDNGVVCQCSAVKSPHIVKNEFWNKWLQKLLAQVISVKIWGFAVLTLLLCSSLLTGSEFMIGFSIIFSGKAGKDIVMRLGNKQLSNDIMDKV